MARRGYIPWDSVLDAAAQIVLSYDTGVTLRQLFYRLVSAEMIPNKQSAYSRLSSLTAKARREGWFPDLIDNTRLIRRPGAWDGSEHIMRDVIDQYRRDRTEGQEYTLYVAVEKNALATQLSHWYNEKGIPVLAFGGYPSQTFVDNITADIDACNRPAVLIYAGDFDATGVDILRDFLKRTAGYWEHQERIALNEHQIDEYNLPPLPGKHWDPRAASFEAQYGKLVQVELDALPPDVLKSIYDEAVDQFWDADAFKAAMEQEKLDREQLLMPDETEALIEMIRDLATHCEDRGLVAYADELLAPYEGAF